MLAIHLVLATVGEAVFPVVEAVAGTAEPVAVSVVPLPEATALTGGVADPVAPPLPLPLAQLDPHPPLPPLPRTGAVPLPCPEVSLGAPFCLLATGSS